jgi:hypothetical protein
MVERVMTLTYNKIMERSSSATNFQAAFNRLLDSLDVRHQRQRTPLRPGETVESAWRNTGMYLRRAMDQYDQEVTHRVSRRPNR